MPTDVDLFNLLKREQLDALSADQLHDEMQRVCRMLNAVYGYSDLVEALWLKTRAPQALASDTGHGKTEAEDHGGSTTGELQG